MFWVRITEGKVALYSWVYSIYFSPCRVTSVVTQANIILYRLQLNCTQALIRLLILVSPGGINKRWGKTEIDLINLRTCILTTIDLAVLRVHLFLLRNVPWVLTQEKVIFFSFQIFEENDQPRISGVSLQYISYLRRTINVSNIFPWEWLSSLLSRIKTSYFKFSFWFQAFIEHKENFQ